MLEVLADDEWFVVGVALVGGVSGKRIIKEGLKNKEGFAPSREGRMKAHQARRDEKHHDRRSLWCQFGGPDQKLRNQHQIQSSWHVHTKHTNMHNIRGSALTPSGGSCGRLIYTMYV